MPRIAIITHEFHPVLCGGTVFVEKLAPPLAELGYEIVVLTAGVGRGFAREERRDGLTIRRYPTGRRSVGDARIWEHVLFFIAALPQMLLHLLRHPCDMLFCMFVIPSGLVGLVVGRLLGIPSVVFVDAADLPGIQSAASTTVARLAPVFRFVARHSSAVIIPDGIQDIAAPLVRNPATVVIPCGVPSYRVCARPGRRGDGVVRFLTIGRLVPRKGFTETVEAFALAARSCTDFHLTIIGYGSYERDIRAAIERCRLSSHVTLAGRVEYSELERYYLSADCYIFYGYREGSSMAMLDALAYGLPIIAADHPGNTTFVRHHYNGLLVAHPDPQKLSEALLEVMGHPEQLPVFGSNSRALAAAFAWPNIARRFDEVFRSALGGPPGGTVGNTCGQAPHGLEEARQ